MSKPVGFARASPDEPPVPITPSAPTPAPTAKAKLTHDEFMAMLRADPRFVVIAPSGKGFILPGLPGRK